MSGYDDRVFINVPFDHRYKKRYITFRLDLPAMCRVQNLDLRDLSFFDYRTLVIGWLDENEW